MPSTIASPPVISPACAIRSPPATVRASARPRRLQNAADDPDDHREHRERHRREPEHDRRAAAPKIPAARPAPAMPFIGTIAPPPGRELIRESVRHAGTHPRATLAIAPYRAPAMTTFEPLEMTCMRCGKPAQMRFAGPCETASPSSTVRFPGVAREVEAEEYVPKVNVTAERGRPQGRLSADRRRPRR